MKGFLKLLLPIFISYTQCLLIDTEPIKLNTIIQGSATINNMKFYSTDLDSNHSNNDLLVESKIINSKTIHESPIILVSTEPLPHVNKATQWVCGQLGSETCLIPSNKIKNLKKIYYGVVCDSCKYSLNSYYINEPVLKDGESQIFHIKQGDKLILKLDEFFNAEKNIITIKSYNMKMTSYKMNVEISDKNKPEAVINVPVSSNWVGGLQAVIKQNSEMHFKNYYFRVIFTAVQDGILNVEARSSNATIKLNDKSLKFDSVKDDINNCYAYSIPKDKADEELIYEIKSIKGEIKYFIFPDNNNMNKANYLDNDNLNGFITLKGRIGDKKTEKILLNSQVRNKQTDGQWKICLTNADTQEKNYLYTIQAYLSSNHDDVKEYQKLLLNILKNDQMYDIKNIELQDKQGKTLIRMLEESKNNIDTSNTNLIQSDATPLNNSTGNDVKTNGKLNEVNYIHINGIGVSGIAVGFLFLISVVIGIKIMMSIFVNTKTIDEPLRMGRIEH